MEEQTKKEHAEWKMQKLELIALGAHICRMGHPETGEGQKRFYMRTLDLNICTAPTYMPCTYKKELNSVAICKFHKEEHGYW